MNPEFIQQLIAELIAANESALGIVVAALARQTSIDPEKLHTDLSAQIRVAQMTKRIPEAAIRQATVALTAVEAEVQIRSSPQKH